VKAVPTQIRCRSHIIFAVVAAVILITLHNWRFWQQTFAVVEPASFSDALFILSLFLLLVFMHAAAMLMVPGRRSLQFIAACFFILAAVAGYFRDTFGVIIDKDMIRNVLRTDMREASDFFSLQLALYVIVLGLIPAVLVARVRLPTVGFKLQFIQRIRFMAVGFLVVALSVLATVPHYASFLREHKSVRNLLNPAEPIYAAFDYWHSTDFVDTGPVADVAGVARRTTATQDQKPLLLFLVVGETVRAQNFQLGGYGRATTPELSQQPGVFYFDNVQSCGTSTAVSLPCMLSHEGRDLFDLRQAARQTNLLDALKSAGLRVEWRENNTGSQGVAVRIKTIEYSKSWPRYVSATEPGADTQSRPHPDSDLCKNGTCFDEIMLSGLVDELANIEQDTAIIFHQLGSHGPAYWQRYPDRFEDFKPVCRTTQLGRCSREEIVNAYDNSIRYTDHNLAEQIRLLTAMSGRADSLLIYVSDHGESLGEKGLYLHGAPFFMAPAEQTRVPLLLWMSDGYRKRFGVGSDCLLAKRSEPLSHDNIYHTVVGGLGIGNQVYDAGRDIMARCRGKGAHAATPANNSRD
jgi:lipid A ethanolaminephosphotransferase